MVSFEEIQAAYYMVAATGVLIAAIFYILNLRISQKNQKISMKNQELMLKAQEQSTKTQQQNLETRQAQLFMSIYEQLKSDEFTTSMYKVIVDSKWSSFKEYWDLWERDQEFRTMSDKLGHFYEGIGVLVREGMLNIRWIALLFCGPTRYYWEKYMPIVEEGRRTLVGNKRWWSESEYLYN